MKKALKQMLAALLTAVILIGAAPAAMAATSKESEPNDSYSTADMISLNGIIKGKMDTDNDTDYYKITAPSDGKLSLTFGHTYSTGDCYWKVKIYYYSGGTYNLLSDISIYVTDSEKVTLPVVGAVANGIYYICVSKGFYSVTGLEYSIQNTFTQTAFFEKEVNNSYSTATVMSQNSTYGGCLESDNDTDYFKITAPSNGKLSLSFNHTFAGREGYWKVGIYYYSNSTYNLLSEIWVYVNSAEKTVLPAVGAVANGIYYVSVSKGFYSVTGLEYSIQNTFTQTEYFEKELNNSYSTATAVTVGAETGGCLNDSNDEDVFKFIAPSTENIPIVFNHTYNNGEGFWNIVIYSYDSGKYTEIFSTTVYQKDVIESKTVYSLAAKANETYYIKISDGFYELIGQEYSFVVGTKTVISYTVSFNANGGSVSPSSLSCVSGNTVTLPTPAKSYNIYYNANGGSGAPATQSVSIGCKGWAVNSNASSAAYACGASFKPSSNITLYAVWNGSENKVLSSVKPTREGYEFLGWATSSSATRADFQAGSTVSVSGNSTLYAVWKETQEIPPVVETQSIDINYKDTYALEYDDFYPIEYYSDNPSVASVTEDGVIYGASRGSTCIHAVDASGYERLIEVNVKYSFVQWLIVIILFGWIWY